MRFARRLRGQDDFPREVGRAISYDTVRGYYIDLSGKAPSEPNADALGRIPLHVITCQWGLGCYDRYLAGEGERWLAGALCIGQHLLASQETNGANAGGWTHAHPMPHTYRLPVGWMSAMAQGQGASLLVRLFLETGDTAFAEGAVRALTPLARSTSQGGVRARLRGGPFLEEYPTHPASYVLNGAIFAVWGYWDTAIALRDPLSRAAFNDVSNCLADNLERWDTGYWSRYDLYPHRFVNVAAPWYHRLHILQLDVIGRMSGRPEFGAIRDRWTAYARSRWNLRRALAQKAIFRLAVPKASLTDVEKTVG